MAAKPPPRVVECHYGHRFKTRATPKRSVRCTHVLAPGDARRDGSGEPHCDDRQCPDRTAAAKGLPSPPDGAPCGSNTYVRPESSASDRRISVWHDVYPWSAAVPFDSLPASGEPCPACGGATARTPRGTALACLACEALRPPERLAERAELREESAASAARVADPAAELAARLDLAERTGKVARTLDRWAAELDPAGLDDYEVYDPAAALADRFGALAREARSARSAAALDAVMRVASDTVGRAKEERVLAIVRAARAELAAEPEPEPGAYAAGEYADDDGPDPLDAVRAQWAARLDRTAARLPDPDSLRPPYRDVALARLAELDDAQAAIEAADSPADLMAATRMADDAIGVAVVAADALRAAIRVPAVARGSLAGGPRALPAAPAPRAPSPADVLRAQARARAARAAAHGYCQSGRHPVVRLLGNALPVAEYIYQGGTVYANGQGQRNRGAPAIKVCASAKCRAAAESWLRGQGYPDNRQVYEGLSA